MNLRRRPSAALMLAALLLTGCQPRQADFMLGAFPPGGVDASLLRLEDGGLPPYEVVASGYNRRIRNLSRMFARIDFELSWREQGQDRLETAEGKLLYIAPDRVMVVLEKLGVVQVVAGSTPQGFWLIDLIDGKREAVIGSHGSVGHTRMPWLRLRPDGLARLLGLMPISTQQPRAAALPPVEGVNGYYLIEPPGSESRLLIEPITYRPVRVDLVDEQGYSYAAAHLTEPVTVDIEGMPAGGRPRVASDSRVVILYEDVEIRLRLFNPAEDHERVRPALFSAPMLLRAYKVPPENVVDLDQPPAR